MVCQGIQSWARPSLVAIFKIRSLKGMIPRHCVDKSRVQSATKRLLKRQCEHNFTHHRWDPSTSQRAIFFASAESTPCGRPGSHPQHSGQAGRAWQSSLQWGRHCMMPRGRMPPRGTSAACEIGGWRPWRAGLICGPTKISEGNHTRPATKNDNGKECKAREQRQKRTLVVRSRHADVKSQELRL